MSKEEKESILKDMLNECLESAKQDGSIESLEYNPETESCISRSFCMYYRRRQLCRLPRILK